ncbi:DUF7266 family protein [Halobaculum marinum]|uniref:Uncharacterized protein n=1 Tax=Halobaculum marinum TaxID=3031996 RepID=A0ABD5WYH9_9EURY|nr:hypothetical protein [Halobaculum sp. DT55]
MTDRRPPGTAASSGLGGCRTRPARDRATSTALSYVLTLGITALLISGLLIAAGGTVDSQRTATTQEALEVVGQQLSSRLMAADRLVVAGGDEVVVRGTYPDAVSGTRYTVTITPGDPVTIELAASSVDVTVTVAAATNTTVAPASVSGGDVEIVYTGGQLEVQSA